MKVRCKNIYNIITKQFMTGSRSLTIGREYIVLEMYIDPSKNVFYKLEGDAKMPTVHDSTQFEIISSHIPSNWVIYQDSPSSNSFTLGPKAWAAENFGEDYENLVPKAIQTYEEEVKIILREEYLESNK